MKEKVVQFGKSASMVGVLTTAEGSSQNDGRPCVIVLNSGILHRVGSCRFHVRLARELASRGFHTLRFDFSGMGDSSARRDSLPFERSSVLEVREAMDFLSSRKKGERFILGGLCSGADAAYFTAVEDPRVVGTVQLDAFAYRNARYLWNHYAPRLADPAVWGRLFNRYLKRFGRPTSPESTNDGMETAGPEATDIFTPEYVREFPPRAEIESNLAILHDRGVKQFYFYSGSMSWCYNYQDQFLDTYRSINFGDAVTVRFVPESDHIVTRRTHQEYVVAEIAAWAQQWWDEPRHAMTPRRNTASSTLVAGATP